MPIADIMTSLFVIFLFIAIIAIKNTSEIKSAFLIIKEEKQSLERENSFMKEAFSSSEDYSENLRIYIETLERNLEYAGNAVSDLDRVTKEIYEKLYDEFKYDLPVWKAEIDPETLIFRFNEPSILFQTNSAVVRPRFKEILSDFFPRYLRVLKEYFDRIEEIRIEGHTSSEWIGAEGEQEAFLKNMQLSQDRTQSVLTYCLNLNLKKGFSDWIRENITTNGFSSTHLIKHDDGQENKAASRRVEFRVYLNYENLIIEIDKRLRNVKS